MKEQITLSICVATYNVESYIIQCLESIKRYEKIINKEIVIVDDGSIDATIKLITEWIHKNPSLKIIFYQNPNNSWPGATYNKAVELSSWKYISFLDSDDFIIESSFKKKLTYFSHNKKLNIVYWNWVFFEKQKFGLEIQPYLSKRFWKSVEDTRKILYTTIPMLSISTAVIKRSFFDQIGWFDNQIWSNDRILNIKIREHIKNKEEVWFDKTACFAYRMHDDNISKNQKKMLKLLSQVVEKYHPEKYKAIGYSNIYFFISLNYLLQGKKKPSWETFYESIRYNFDIKRIFVYFFAFFIPHTILINFPPKLKSSLKKFFQHYFQ